MKLFFENDFGVRCSVNLYDVCEWLVERYPESVFNDSFDGLTEGAKAVHIMRDNALFILQCKNKE